MFDLISLAKSRGLEAEISDSKDYTIIFPADGIKFYFYHKKYFNKTLVIIKNIKLNKYYDNLDKVIEEFPEEITKVLLFNLNNLNKLKLIYPKYLYMIRELDYI